MWKAGLHSSSHASTLTGLPPWPVTQFESTAVPHARLGTTHDENARAEAVFGLAPAAADRGLALMAQGLSP